MEYESSWLEENYKKLIETVFDEAREAYNGLRKQSIIIQNLCRFIASHTKDAVTTCLERYEEVD